MSHGPGPAGGRGRVAPGQRSKDFKRSFRRLVGELRPDLVTLIGALIVSAAGVVLAVIAPRVLGHGTNIIYDGIVSKMIAGAPSKEAAVAALRAKGQDNFATMLEAMDVTPGAGIDFTALWHVLVWVIVIYVVSAVLSYISGYLLRLVIQNTGYRMRNQVQQKIERLPLSYLDSHSRGDLMSRVSNDVDNVTQVMNQTLSQLFQSVLTIIGILVMMLSMSWKLTLLAMIVIPVGGALAVTLMGRAQPQFTRQWKSTGDVSGTVEEALTGHEVVALYGLEDRFTDEFNASNSELYDASFRAQFISNLIMPIMSLISNCSYVIVAVGGGLMVAHGSMSLGDVQAFIQYSRQFTLPIGQLASMANSLQSGVASAERIFEFLDAPEMEPDEGATSFALARSRAGSADSAPATTDEGVDAHTEEGTEEVVQGRIIFDHVRFGYTPDRPVIKDLSLSVEPGQMVAIIGPTGAGKTTLVNLIMRFYELDSGSISIDGVDIRDLNKDTLRSHTGMVLQDTWLFEGSIEENIAFGREGATHEDVVEAARSTSSDRLIRQLPQGYDTPISDEGDTVSVGERQLLTIARAFISRPDLLILDEATSSVDTRTEVLVQRAMDHLRRGRTAFVIAHRLSTIRDADLIMVMEEGDVVETGRHQELLDRGGAYARLYQAQFSGPEGEETDQDGIDGIPGAGGPDAGDAPQS